MHTRQRGAAHINIFYFLIILVMFFGVLGFGYLQLTKNTDLEGQLAAANAAQSRLTVDNLLLTHYMEDISAAINLSGQYGGRNLVVYDNGLPPEDPNYYIATLPVEGVADLNQIQVLLQQFAARVSVPEATGLPEFLNRIGTAYDALNQRLSDGEAQRQQLVDEKSTADTSFTQAAASAAQRERDLNSQMTTVRDDLQGQIDQQANLMTGLTQNVQAARAELSDEQESHSADVRRLSDEKNVVQAQNDATRQRLSLINAPQAPDGRVITASQELGFAWINLGRKDMLQSGTVFRITEPGNPSSVKALATVTRVQDAQSEVAITNLVDAFDPVTPGDLISNDLYSPNVRRNIYLLGRFGHPYSKSDVKDLLERLGNTVVDSLQPGVDLVVVGNNLIDEETGTMILLDETPEYRLVQDLSIEVAPLNRIRDFLQFDR